VLSSEEYKEKGTITADLRGDIEFKNVTVSFGEKSALKDISLRIKGGTRTAIIGPTAAGKTQLLYLLTGLTRPTSGSVLYDGKSVDEYDKQALHRQVGFVFQDSIVFSMTLRENIAFSEGVTKEDMHKAIETAELSDFIASLPLGLETQVSERGTSLSGGQKQRIMLARALALNPRILLLDDFTARVDARTEQSILKNLNKNYPGITLVSITQKIASASEFDHILFIMEGELLASGTHETLLGTSPEYAQIAESQHSTTHYEL
jgi:ATP-binding cassette subfamily B protein